MMFNLSFTPNVKGLVPRSHLSRLTIALGPDGLRIGTIVRIPSPVSLLSAHKTRTHPGWELTTLPDLPRQQISQVHPGTGFRTGSFCGAFNDGLLPLHKMCRDLGVTEDVIWNARAEEVDYDLGFAILTSIL